MVSDYKKKNNQKIDIIIISGVSIDKTPVIKSLIDYYSNRKIIILEYQHKKRLSFLLNGYRLVRRYKNSHIFFIGLQCLPLLAITHFFLKNPFYWELETYNIHDSNSLAIQMLYFQKLINWSKVNLILPHEARWNIKDKRMLNKKIIIPNVPLSGNSFEPRTLNGTDQINLILYGNLDNEYVYLTEWIEFAKKESSIFLMLIGRNIDQNIIESLPKNVKYKKQVNHKELLSLLKDYHFSIVGYRPVDFNHKYCVPNKLFEAFSFSLPVIANKKNPTLVKIVNETKAGMLIDFEVNIYEQLDIDKIRLNYDNYSLKSFNAYKNKYYFEYFAKTQLDNIVI